MIRVTNNPTGRPAYSWKDMKRASGNPQAAAQQAMQRRMLEQQQRAAAGSAISTGLRDYGDPVDQPGAMAALTGGMPVQSAVQPGQATFIPGSATNPAAVSTMNPAQSTSAPMQSSAQGSPFGQTQIGLGGAESAYLGGLRGALGMYDMANQQGRADLTGAAQQANTTLQPFYGAGQGASDYQAALAGALGDQAQADAFDRFRNSPGQQYLLNESERAIKRNAAATGGLGGGNVQRALQENAIGLAAQDFDNSFRRLGAMSDRGLAAGGQISGNLMNTGGALANLGAQMGNNAAGATLGVAGQIGGSRTQAGRDIAQNAADTAGNMANLTYGGARDISNVIGQGSSNLADILRAAGVEGRAAQQALAGLITNIETSAGNQYVGLPGTPVQPVQTPGALGDIGNLLSGIGGFGQGFGFGNNRA